MKDKESFRELELKAQVAPSQSTWPTDYLHWQLLSRAADETRSCLGEFYEHIEEIDTDPRLTPQGKAQERRKAAERALQALDEPKTLNRAQEAVAAVEAKWEAMIAKAIEKPTEPANVAVATQIRDRVANMKEGRMSWLERHAGDLVIASAILTAPQALSGLSDAEWRLVRLKVEGQVLSPEVREAKAAITKAKSELERGWRNARAKISARGGFDAAWPQDAA